MDPQLDWLMGTALISAGSQSGIAYLEKSLSALPAGAGPRIELAAAYLMAGRRSDALGVLDAIPPAERTPQVRRLVVFANIIHRPKNEALAAVRDLVAKYPKDAPLLGAAGGYALSIGENDVAESYLERSRQLDPRDVLPRMALAQLAVGRGQLGRAEQLLRETIALDPHAQVAYLGLSGLRWARGARDEAQQLLQQAIAADPGAVAARLRLAQIAFAIGEPARGRALLDQAAKVAPNDPEVFNATGEVLLAIGHLDEALARFSTAAATGSARAKLNVARTQMALGKAEDARHLLEATAADPHGDRFEPGVLLVGLDARQGRVADALARLAGLRRAGLPEAVADEIAGDTYVVAGRLVEASKAYELAAAKRPTSTLVVKVFRVRQALNSPDPQRDALRWLESSPGDRRVRRDLAEYLQRIGHRDAAITEYERLRQGPGAQDPVLLNNLACLYIESKDPRAAELARAAHELAPESAEITDTYGWVLVKTGKILDGMELLREAARGAPENADIAYHVAAGTAFLGDEKKARELLARLLRSKVVFTSRAEAEALRSELGAQ
jgi:cellulose synthase operon protein C